MSEEPKSLEGVVLSVVKTYVGRKLSNKYDLDWKSASASDDAKNEYNEKRAKIAKEAFLAVRARSGPDFIEYFVSSLCSVPQFLPESTFVFLSQQLYANTERVRTLTLLALSANS